MVATILRQVGSGINPAGRAVAPFGTYRCGGPGAAGGNCGTGI